MNLFNLKRSVSAYELINIFHLSNAEIKGNASSRVNQFAPITNATENCISFVDLSSFTETEAILKICDSKASILVVPKDIIHLIRPMDCTFLVVNNPRAIFINLIKKLGIVPLDYIKVGKHCIINKQAIIGDTSSGYDPKKIRDDPFPQIGYVEIGNYVTIQAFSVICRGSIGTTIIGNYVEIQKFVNINHNVKIGDYSFIGSHACVLGSVSIGNDTWIAPGSIIRDHVHIGNNCLVGIGSVVVNDIPDNIIVKGNPAR